MLLLVVAAVAVALGLGRRWDRFGRLAGEHAARAVVYSRSAALSRSSAEIYGRIAENRNPAWTAQMLGRGTIDDPGRLRAFSEEMRPRADEYREVARRAHEEATRARRLAEQEERESAAYRDRW
jgi:hypothetical protein